MSGAPSSAAAAFLHAGGRSHCRPWCLLHLTAEQKLFPDSFCSFQAEPAGQSPQALLSGSPAWGHIQSSQVAAAFQPPRLFFIENRRPLQLHLFGLMKSWGSLATLKVKHTHAWSSQFYCQEALDLSGTSFIHISVYRLVRRSHKSPEDELVKVVLGAGSSD